MVIDEKHLILEYLINEPPYKDSDGAISITCGPRSFFMELPKSSHPPTSNPMLFPNGYYSWGIMPQLEALVVIRCSQP